jgi:hypothetical protein
MLMTVVTAFGWALGAAIRGALPLGGLAGFVAECALWLIVVGVVSSPLLIGRLRTRLSEMIPG